MRFKDAAWPLADYHLHTTASDGRKSPEAMVQLAVDAGLCQMAVTDHDTVAGVVPAARAAAGRIPLVPGIEFTCREEVLAPGLLCTAGSDCHGIPPRDRVGVPCPPGLPAAMAPLCR